MSNFKLSYYSIFTDPLNSKQDRVLYCTRTGQALVIKDQIYQTINAGDFEILSKEDLEKLVQHKAIVEVEENELASIIGENKDVIEDVNTLYEVIQISGNCQLGCDYCGQHHTKNFLDEKIYAGLISRIRSKATLKKYKTLYIGWFGGEPLMGYKQIRELTALLKELATEFGMTYGAKIVTNGMSLKENVFLELVNELGIRHIEVTLDGIAPFHDTRRITKQCASTFDIIFKNLLTIFNREDFKKFNCRITLRCNVDERNVEGVSPLIKLLAENNLQNKIDYFYPIGVYSWSKNDAHKKSLTKEEFAEREIGWFLEMIELGFTVSLLPGRIKSVCMAVSKASDVYDPYGNIFTCTEVTLTPVYEATDYKVGNLNFPVNTYSDRRTHSNWNDEILDGKFPCSTCKMLPVCGGACPKSWHEDMRACPPSKFNIKRKLELSYVVAKGNIKELLADEV